MRSFLALSLILVASVPALAAESFHAVCERVSADAAGLPVQLLDGVERIELEVNAGVEGSVVTRALGASAEALSVVSSTYDQWALNGGKALLRRGRDLSRLYVTGTPATGFSIAYQTDLHVDELESLPLTSCRAE